LCERSRAGGFTIIEMMVVIAIAGLLLAAATLSFYNIIRSDLRSAASRTAAAMRFAFDKATMTGMSIRLAFDLDKGQVWLEGSEDRVTLGRDGEVLSDRERRPDQAGEGEGEGEGGEGERPKKKPSPALEMFGLGGGGDSSEEEGFFQPAIDTAQMMREVDRDMAPIQRAPARFVPLKGMLTKKLKLAKGIRVDAVVTPRLTEPVESGTAHVYFFPQGHSEPAIVHFANKDDEYYSVVLHPLTGQARVYPCLYKIPSDFGVDDDKRRRKHRDPCAEMGGI
jgi:prepilin-type N-terminal cleavage/methylation domain-containing protein